MSQERKQEEERQVQKRRIEEEEEREVKKRKTEKQERRQAERREEERAGVEAETVDSNEDNAKEAPRHARDTFDSLRSLRRAYHFVCGQRSHCQELEAPLKAFERLVALLHEGRDRRDVKDVREHAGTLRLAAGTGERVVATRGSGGRSTGNPTPCRSVSPSLGQVAY